jgi:hypothetical protein
MYKRCKKIIFKNTFNILGGTYFKEDSSRIKKVDVLVVSWCHHVNIDRVFDPELINYDSFNQIFLHADNLVFPLIFFAVVKRLWFVFKNSIDLTLLSPYNA